MTAATIDAIEIAAKFDANHRCEECDLKRASVIGGPLNDPIADNRISPYAGGARQAGGLATAKGGVQSKARQLSFRGRFVSLV